MKYFYSLVFISFMAFSCKEASVEKKIMQKDIVEAIVGEYDNFQQCWQENTQEGIHKIEIEQTHRHIHTVIRKTDYPGWLYVRMSEGRDTSQILQESGWKIKRSNGELQVDVYEWADNLLTEARIIKPSYAFEWQDTGSAFKAKIGEDIWQLRGDTLSIEGAQSGLFANSTDYRLLRCRFFSGWIEYPLPEIPDSTYRMGNLRIHDQGGIVQLILGDGRKTDYSAELTQLVYGRQLSIMKLAIYKEPFEDIHYNSRSISYTWTEPEGKRAGINLRKVSSGWTFIEPGFVSSNNMKVKK